MKIFMVVEAGWDIDAIPFTVVDVCRSYEAALQSFRQQLRTQVGYGKDTDDEKDASNFDKEYQEALESGKYDDYEERYILKIVVADVAKES